MTIIGIANLALQRLRKNLIYQNPIFLNFLKCMLGSRSALIWKDCESPTHRKPSSKRTQWSLKSCVMKLVMETRTPSEKLSRDLQDCLQARIKKCAGYRKIKRETNKYRKQHLSLKIYWISLCAYLDPWFFRQADDGIHSRTASLAADERRQRLESSIFGYGPF